MKKTPLLLLLASCSFPPVPPAPPLAPPTALAESEIGPDVGYLRQIGFACTGANGVVPIIAPVGMPYLGTTFRVRYNLDYSIRSPYLLDCWIWISDHADRFIDQPLPLYLGGIGMEDFADEGALSPTTAPEAARGCRIYIGEGASMLIPAGFDGRFGAYERHGNAVMLEFPLPNVPTLIGATFYTQMMIYSQGANRNGSLTSNAVRFTLGVQTMMDNLMIDIETCSQGHHAMVVSVGACLFDPLTGECDLRPYYGAVDIADPLAGVPDADTLAWWLKQDPDVMRREFTAGPRLQMPRVLTQLISYGQPAKVVWDKGRFDVRVLTDACERCQITWPWEHRASRDYRTLKEVARAIKCPEAEEKEIGDWPKHSAVGDAVRQADCTARILEWLRQSAAAAPTLT